MKPLVALAAAILLAAPSAANARNVAINLDGFCDLVAFEVETPVVVGVTDDSCEAGVFVGAIAKVKGMDREVVLASLAFKNRPGRPYVLQVDYPFKDGGVWSIFYTKDGNAVSPFATGVYKVWGPGAAPKPSGPRLTDVLKRR
ncbi:MAG TPA: hypothetical protein VG843_07925 [Rhizomicrobium sp.]|nr:hypothetical protein [Rhizomicrobium sp.]